MGKTIRHIHLAGGDYKYAGNFDILLYEYCQKHQLSLIRKNQKDIKMTIASSPTILNLVV